MIQPTAALPKTFYPAPSFNKTARIAARPQIDAQTKHRVYDHLLDLLAEPQIQVKKTGATLPFVLHPLVKAALVADHGFTAAEIAKQENGIRRAAEFFRDYEVARKVPAALRNTLEKTGDADSIFENRIVALPGPILNAMVCGELQKEFGRRTLLSCDGFIEARATDGRGFTLRAVRLDIDGWIVRRGFMLPVYRNDLIAGLKVFRHPHDERPFILRSRAGGQA